MDTETKSVRMYEGTKVRPEKGMDKKTRGVREYEGTKGRIRMQSDWNERRTKVGGYESTGAVR
jgi:hypothetical protein